MWNQCKAWLASDKEKWTGQNVQSIFISTMIELLQGNCYSKAFHPIALDHRNTEGDTESIKHIGGWFIGDDSCGSEAPVFTISPLHGRVAAHFDPQNGWTLIKGVGWTYGGPGTLVSPKDDELFFGLCDEVSAEREYLVSQWMQENEIRATPVLGYARIDIENLQKPAFRNGKAVNPVLLYTRVISPFRVMDLAYLSDLQKSRAIALTALTCGWSEKHFLYDFFEVLVDNVAMFQSLGGCNDTLDFNNVTLAAEITDFEWVSVPGIPLSWGDGTCDLEVRRQKEVIYLYEIGIQLASFLAIHNPHKRLIDIISSGFSNRVPEVLAIISMLKNE